MTSPDKFCPLCGDKIINWGAHAERCYGRNARIADPPAREPVCGCPPGAWHLKTCEAAYWPDNGGDAA